jgi:hypothetical protein
MRNPAHDRSRSGSPLEEGELTPEPCQRPTGLKEWDSGWTGDTEP